MTYSAWPNVNIPTFRLRRYAGATIIDTPKFAAVSIATASESRATARI